MSQLPLLPSGGAVAPQPDSVPGQSKKQSLRNSGSRWLGGPWGSSPRRGVSAARRLSLPRSRPLEIGWIRPPKEDTLSKLALSLRSWRRAATFAAALLLLVLLLPPPPAQSRPTTPAQARRVVQNWLALDPTPLGAVMGRQVTRVQTFFDDAGNAVYYVVYLHPAGFVIVPGDDLVEPIVGFLPQGYYYPSPVNPLGALVSRDVPGRVAHVREKEAQARAQGLEFVPMGLLRQAQRKWGLLDRDTPPSLSELGLPSVSDERVPPLVESKWGQENIVGNYCYNYFTPNHYPSGCVATAMSQLMRFYNHPTTGVGTASFTIWVDGVEESESLRGGDGGGGAYVWGNMVLVPDVLTSDAQRRAIGDLTHDTGVSVNMEYTSSGSGANTLDAATAFLNTFGYSNAKTGYNSGNNLPSSSRNAMVNPNLDAGYPVLFGITGPAGGHAVVGDGYGYQTSTLYHHLNLGWDGNDDAWYNLPNIDSSPSFDTVTKCVYNVYVSGAGEIISGRVTDGSGVPVNGAVVTATRTGGGTYNATTNSKGIYALAKILPASSYTLNVTKTGYTFAPQTATVGTSINNTLTTGNIWGKDFSSGGGKMAPVLHLLLLD